MWLERLNYVKRLLGTGFAFLCFFGGGLLMALIVFPLIALLVRGTARRTQVIHNVIRQSFRMFVAMLEGIGILKLKVINRSALDDGRGRLVIANHPTLLDVVFLMALMPRVQCIVKGELWRHPFLGGVVRWAGYVRNDLEPDELLRACQESMAAGKNLIVFPKARAPAMARRCAFGAALPISLCCPASKRCLSSLIASRPC